jgi:hypothetical protein
MISNVDNQFSATHVNVMWIPSDEMSGKLTVRHLNMQYEKKQ